MTKAPERLWAYEAFQQVTAARSTTWFPSWAEPREYVLNDHALALVAGAYEDAAEIGSIWPVQTEIRARTPDDATAALERVKQEVAEQAAKLADEWYHNSGHGSPGDEIRAALITEDQSDG